MHKNLNPLNDLISFGKYKGKHIKDVPEKYLTWVINNLKYSPMTKNIFEYMENKKDEN